jgi:putative ABC transport system substrate-binding protein
MDRRVFLGTLAGGLLAAPLAAVGKEAAKTARVGILNVGPAPSPEQLAESRLRSPFWLALKELGWVYGQNIVAETRWGESAEQLHAAAADLVRLKVDLLFTTGASLARILQLETKTIPIVVLMAGADLVADGLVASLARPGGNLTGSQVLQGDLIAKRLELLKTLVPSLSRVAFLQESVTTSVLPQLRVRYDQQAAVAASNLGIGVHTFVVQRPEDFASAFLGMMKARDQGLVIVSTPFMYVHRQDIVDLAVKHRIATIFEAPPYVEVGGLMSYGVSLPEMVRRAAVYIDKILRGANPADLPIEQPTKWGLTINLKTAKALGLTIPPSLLQRADQVIE